MLEPFALLRAMGGIRAEYVMDTAQALGNVETKPKTVRFNRRLLGTLLAAAVILSLLTGFAYASGLFGLREMRVENGLGHDEPIVNTSGFQGSAEFQASAEWARHLEELYENGDNLLSPGEECNIYTQYGAHSPQARADLDKLLNKYSLTLPSNMVYFRGISGLYELLGIQGFLPESGAAKISPLGGQFYQGGSFMLVDTVETGSGKNISIDMYRYVKGCFIRGTMLRADTDRMEEWQYSTADGTEIIVALGPTQSAIFAELKNSFVYINIRSGSDNDDESRSSFGCPSLSRYELEQLADSIDFTVLDSIGKVDNREDMK